MQLIRSVFPHPWGWASVAPIVCAIHCALTPLLILIAPALAPGHRVEAIVLGLTSIVAGWALFRGYPRYRGIGPLLLVVVGLMLWGGSLLDLFRPVPETVTSVAAALVVAFGLMRNAQRLCQAERERACACPSCEVLG